MINTKLESKITNLLLVSLVLTDNQNFDLKNTIKDIYHEFSEIKFKIIKQGILNGIKKDFNKSDEFCTQLICIWIRTEIKIVENKKPKL
jgi:hypothetical protein